MNISTEADPKFAKIGDFWDDATVDKVIELLRKYQDLFPTKFTDLKGIIGDLSVMKITLKPDVKPVKKSWYPLKSEIQGEGLCRTRQDSHGRHH